MTRAGASPLATLALSTTLLAAAPLAQANATADPFVNPSFAIASDGFNNLIAARVTPLQLIAGINSNVALPAGSGGGRFRRTTGTAYPASFGIYEWNGARSTFEYAVSQAASGVTSIVMQTFITVDTSQGVYGMLTPDSLNLPRLSFNGGSQFLSATTQVTQSVSGGWGMDGNPVPASPNNPNYLTFTWDLSSVGAAIDSFRLTWATDAHTSTLAFQVDQIGAVPEPGTLALAIAALTFIGGAHRLQQKRQRATA